MSRLPLIAIAFLAATAPGYAAIVLSGNFNSGTPTPKLTITEDIVFTMVAAGTSSYLVFDEWTTNDGSATYIMNDPDPQSFFYSINGGSDMEGFISGLTDNFANNSGDLSANDGGLAMEFTANAGDTVTIRAGSFTFSNGSAVNPDLNGKTFTGNVFFTAFGTEARITNVVTVPEPGTALLCALALPALLRRRR